VVIMPSNQRPGRRPVDLLRRLVDVRPGEMAALFWACGYFCALLCSYYIVRPLRDEMGVAGGVEHLQWLFTGTFIAMLAAVPLFGWVSSRYPRRRFLPAVYGFFILNLLLFFLLFRAGLTHAWVARAFFIWASVFNLFVVSVFWSFMADIFSNARARRLFGFIAAGGTLGAVAGPLLTTLLAQSLGPTNLLPLSAGLLGVAMLCIQRLGAWQPPPGETPDPPAQNDAAMGGAVLAGMWLVLRTPYLLGICLLMLLLTLLSTFLYFQQAEIVRDAFSDPGQRTAVFAAIDLAVNVLTLACQLLLTGRLVRRFGLAWTLALVPLLLAAGFLALWLAPQLAVLVTVQVLRRAGNYAVMRPAREMLYVVLGREEKYKAKNFIDTVVYRGGDALSAWLYAGLATLGLGLSAIALLAVPLSLLWARVAYGLGQAQTRRATAESLS